MGRKSEVNYYDSKGAYMTTYLGTRYRLLNAPYDDSPDGPYYLEACKIFGEIKAGKNDFVRQGGKVQACVDYYLERLESGNKRTYHSCRSLLKKFKADMGHLDVAFIEPHHVHEWVRSQSRWGPGTRHLALATIKACFSLSKKAGRIKVNPLADTWRPNDFGVKPRGSEFVLSDELIALLLAAARPDFRVLLNALWKTGARPIELLEARSFNLRPDPPHIHYDADARRGYVWKNAKKKTTGDRTRRIFLDAETAELVRSAARQGEFLFTTRRGKRWRSTSISFRWPALRQNRAVAAYLAEHDIREEFVIPYSFRHTFITRAIERGVPIKVVADLCGTSVTMIERNYCHASSNLDWMHKAYLSCLK